MFRYILNLIAEMATVRRFQFTSSPNRPLPFLEHGRYSRPCDRQDPGAVDGLAVGGRLAPGPDIRRAAPRPHGLELRRGLPRAVPPAQAVEELRQTKEMGAVPTVQRHELLVRHRPLAQGPDAGELIAGGLFG